MHDAIQWSKRGARSYDIAGHIKIRRGAYAHPEWWRGLPRYEQYRVRVEVASLSLKNPIFALESAAVFHGLPVFGEPRIHLYSLHAQRTCTRGDVTVHASCDPREVVTRAGVSVTSLLDTTVDLLRVLPLALGVAVLDAALRLGLSLDAVKHRLRTQASKRGRRQALNAVDLADPRSESVLESLSRVVIGALGFRPPELQVSFRLDEGTSRADFFWRDVSVVGEADGAVKYDARFGPEVQAIRNERKREVALLRVVRRVARWEWMDVWHPDRLERILTAAGVPRDRPADPHIDRLLRNKRTRHTIDQLHA
ncbi:hypothetical protein [Microbacterium sp. C7(2022)]|uniref:hypothetical protein n=1 Tax=Microbacterium sp. C7(2022) TaxID=2992759 RepID=UPI00237B575D|nr:hypothetical protein [Microbacterium sp. C7(2022)]MDE0547656.1 hypothetical protein [Microbacterium sp. C7(2022)]